MSLEDGVDWTRENYDSEKGENGHAVHCAIKENVASSLTHYQFLKQDRDDFLEGKEAGGNFRDRVFISSTVFVIERVKEFSFCVAGRWLKMNPVTFTSGPCSRGCWKVRPKCSAQTWKRQATPARTIKGCSFPLLKGELNLESPCFGASVKTYHALARHPTSVLTIGIYARASIYDINGGAERMPGFTRPEVQTGPPLRPALMTLGCRDLTA